MSDLYEKIVSERGSFERLMARIPGFRGYLDKATRRTADQLLRDFVVGRMTQRVRRFADLERRVLDLSDGFSMMSRTSQVKSKLQLYRDKFNAVTPGFSGFADAVKVDEEALESLYAFDEAQVRYVEQFDGALDVLDQAIKARAGQTQPAEGSAVTSVEDALSAVEGVAVEALDSLSLRDSVLTNLSKVHGG